MDKSNKEKKVIPIGHGYVLGWRATGHEIVRKSRNEYECEFCLIDSDTCGEEISPATGNMVRYERSEACSSFIRPGELYVALELEGDDAQEFGAAFRYTMRTCMSCALEAETVATQVSN